ETVQSGAASVMVWDMCSWRDMGPLIRLEMTLTGTYAFCPITYTHSCPMCIPTDWDNSSRTMRHPTRRELLPSSSRNTLLTSDTSIGQLNPQRRTLLKISGMLCYMLLRRDLHHLSLLWIF
ncbi:hypothetical protein AVEN_123555-1, partial [Araneus ventricosus]